MRRRVELQQMTGALEIGPAGRTQEAIGADLGEAAREDVLEEARDERVHRERCGASPACARAV